MRIATVEAFGAASFAFRHFGLTVPLINGFHIIEGQFLALTHCVQPVLLEWRSRPLAGRGCTLKQATDIGVNFLLQS